MDATVGTLGATEHGSSRLLCEKLDLQALSPYDSKMVAPVELAAALATAEAHRFDSLGHAEEISETKPASVQC